MATPLFSIVIPTRNRHQTLGATLRTCLGQDFDDYEVVVGDNCSTPETRAVVEEASSDRIRYVRSDAPLNWAASWSFAVSRARGEYVTVLGADDAVMPYGLRELASLVARHRPEAVRCSMIVYVWPGAVVPEESNHLVIPLDRFVREVDGRETIAEVLSGGTGLTVLPNIYHGVIRRDLIERLREKTGRLFASCFPDCYSCFAFGWLARRYLITGVPLFVNGVSSASNAATSFVPHIGPCQTGEVGGRDYLAGEGLHPWVPDLPVPIVLRANGYLCAKEALFPDDQTVRLDRKHLVRQCVASLWTDAPDERGPLLQKIRDTLADAPELLAWFDATDFMSKPSRPLPSRLRSGRGYDGRLLCVNAADFGVADVADAVGLATRLLGFDKERIAYDLPARDHLAAEHQAALDGTLAELDATRAQLATVREDLARTRQTLDGSWAGLPQRLVRRARAMFRPKSN